MTLNITIDSPRDEAETEAAVEKAASRLRAGDVLTIRHDFAAKTPEWLRRVLHRHLLRTLASEPRATIAAPIEPLLAPGAESLHAVERSGTSIVIVCYNSTKTIDRCLESLFHTLSDDDEVIALDNGSSDQTGTCLIHKLSAWGGAPADSKSYKLLLSQENLGYTRGCNLGLMCAAGRTVCFLNPDTTVEPGWLEALRARLDERAVGAVGPVTDYVAGDQFVEKHLGKVTPPLSGVSSTLRQVHAGGSDVTKMLVGFCLMMRHETFAKIGLFDEDLVLGSDDLELSLRLRSHGYSLLVAKDVFVHHEGGASFATVKPNDIQARLDESTRAMRRKLRAAFAPDKEPRSEDIWGIGILPQDEA